MRWAKYAEHLDGKAQDLSRNNFFPKEPTESESQTISSVAILSVVGSHLRWLTRDIQNLLGVQCCASIGLD